MHRDREKQKEPTHFPRPWDTSSQTVTFTPDEVEQAVVRLTRRSAFRDRE